jgi:hypothetical protein
MLLYSELQFDVEMRLFYNAILMPLKFGENLIRLNYYSLKALNFFNQTLILKIKS